MNLNILKAKLKHLGQKELYALGVANYIPIVNKWVFMYDFDKGFNKDDLDISIPYEVYLTKHGFNLLYYKLMDLDAVYKLFQKFKDALGGDYFWTVPLWIRIGP